MSFTTLKFLVFVLVTGIIYFGLPKKESRYLVLLGASYVFYLFTGWKYIFYILFTTATSYKAALMMDELAAKSKEELKKNKEIWDKDQKKAFKGKIKKRRKTIMVLTLVANFGILSFLKYFNFLAGSINDVIGAAEGGFSIPTLKLLLPLGISFYTFQTMGYVIDVYREKVKAEKNFAKIALFVSFFPQIIQGPISFYNQLAGQLYEGHDFSWKNLKSGLELILWGLFKKLVIADRAAIGIYTVVGDLDQYNGTTVFLTVLLYALQIYTDFSGGIDITRGVAEIFGIHMAENFKRPYFAKNINDYWRRWHITLGAWMKDYIFYPIALSRGSANLGKKIKNSKFGASAAGQHVAKVLPTCLASVVVFLVVGIWHGADWKYVAFGLWNGLIIMFSALLKPVFDKMVEKLHLNRETFGYDLFQMIRTFIIVLIGYVFDIAPGFVSGMKMIGDSICRQNITEGIAQMGQIGLAASDYWVLLITTLFLWGVSIRQEKTPEITTREKLDAKPYAVQFAVLFAGVLAVLIFGIYGQGYSASNFVYMQF